MANEKAWYIFWFSRTKGTAPLSLFNLITLITHLFFLLPFTCLACLCACLCLCTLAHAPYTGCWLISTLYLLSLIVKTKEHYGVRYGALI